MLLDFEGVFVGGGFQEFHIWEFSYQQTHSLYIEPLCIEDELATLSLASLFSESQTKVLQQCSHVINHFVYTLHELFIKNILETST